MDLVLEMQVLSLGRFLGHVELLALELVKLVLVLDLGGG